MQFRHHRRKVKYAHNTGVVQHWCCTTMVVTSMSVLLRGQCCRGQRYDFLQFLPFLALSTAVHWGLLGPPRGLVPVFSGTRHHARGDGASLSPCTRSCCESCCREAMVALEVLSMYEIGGVLQLLVLSGRWSDRTCFGTGRSQFESSATC